MTDVATDVIVYKETAKPGAKKGKTDAPPKVKKVKTDAPPKVKKGKTDAPPKVEKNTNTDTLTAPIDNVVSNKIEIRNIEGLQYLATITNSSIDLILTDPPYIISKETGMNSHFNKVEQNEINHIDVVKTEEEWVKYKTDNNIADDDNKRENYLKYGTIYGTKYCVKTNYGKWDSEFTIELLEKFIGEFYKKLKKGGTMIIFFDLWKLSFLKDIMERHKFKQIRFIEWIKTNPQPLNSSVNYLTNCREIAVSGIKEINDEIADHLNQNMSADDVTNCREIALVGVKDRTPTFNSKYDKGIYEYPIQGGKNRIHPTQKSLGLFEELINKHSNENDVVLDTFLGGGTTAIACKNTKRKFKGCEISPDYFDKVMKIIQ